MRSHNLMGLQQPCLAQLQKGYLLKSTGTWVCSLQVHCARFWKSMKQTANFCGQCYIQYYRWLQMCQFRIYVSMEIFFPPFLVLCLSVWYFFQFQLVWAIYFFFFFKLVIMVTFMALYFPHYGHFLYQVIFLLRSCWLL